MKYVTTRIDDETSTKLKVLARGRGVTMGELLSFEITKTANRLWQNQPEEESLRTIVREELTRALS